MNPTPVGMRCPECSKQTTQVRNMSVVTNPRIFDVAPVTTVLIAINVAVFVLGYLGGGGRGGTLYQHGALDGPLIANGEWWRLVSSGFLHDGLLHVGFNMFVLYVLGMMLEPAIGRVRFGLIYFISLLAGSLGSLLMQPNAIAVGASGAVFGLMGAALVAHRSRGINPFQSGIGFLLLMNLGLTFFIRGIAIGGHIGGLIGGIVAGFILIELDETRQVFGRSMVPAAALSVLLGIGIFVASLAIAQPLL